MQSTQPTIEPPKKQTPKLAPIILITSILLLVLTGVIAFFFYSEAQNKNIKTDNNGDKDTKAPEAKKSWTEKGVAIAGNYADADIVKLADGTYRMYYGIEPEVPGNNLE